MSTLHLCRICLAVVLGLSVLALPPFVSDICKWIVFYRRLNHGFGSQLVLSVVHVVSTFLPLVDISTILFPSRELVVLVTSSGFIL